jgi:hypothetical protein
MAELGKSYSVAGASDGLELVGKKIARPGGTKNVLKMPPGFTYAAK